MRLPIFAYFFVVVQIFSLVFHLSFNLSLVFVSFPSQVLPISIFRVVSGFDGVSLQSSSHAKNTKLLETNVEMSLSIFVKCSYIISSVLKPCNFVLLIYLSLSMAVS